MAKPTVPVRRAPLRLDHRVVFAILLVTLAGLALIVGVALLPLWLEP